MPTNTPRLAIPKPLGTEAVSRAAFNTIYDTIDANAATRKEPEVLAADIFVSGFVISGMVASKNATTATQLNVTAGGCYVQQADGGLRRFTPAAASFTTSLASAVYYLDFQPDGTYSWGTAHSAQTGYLPVAEVTTDAAGAIATVTDKRPLVPGIGKVNANLLRGRDLAAEHDAHLAETVQAHGDHDSQDILLTRDANGKLTGIDVKKPDDLGVSRITATLSFDANGRLSSVLEKELDTDGTTVKSQATTTILRDVNGRITELEVR